MALTTLKRRAEFQRVRGGGRRSTAAFVLEGKARPAATTAAGAPGVAKPVALDRARFGFTVTKKLGNAVVRNRIRRRLKAAVQEVAGAVARPHFDYVVIAREAALAAPFASLVADMSEALARVHAGGPGQPAGRGRGAQEQSPRRRGRAKHPEKPSQ